jgi:hypothetical protein
LAFKEKLKKLRNPALVVAGLLLLATPRIVWRLKRARTLEVVIVDKTVPFQKYREHAAIPWILHALKIRSAAGSFLDPARDYVGFEPKTKTGTDLTPAHLEHADALVVADTYGVYRGDYEKPGDEAALERSPKIYGGFEQAEANAVEAFATSGKLVIGEFNTFASPTPPPARETLERVFGVRWTKWVGRYWANLQDPNEVPPWVGRVWEKVTHTPFDKTGGAMVFVREDEDIIVLQDGVDLGERVITQEPTALGKALQFPERGGFWFWMDVVEPTDGEVLYEHVIDATPAGEKQLADHKLGRRFPALTKRSEAWYFAGDFVDTTIDLGNPESYGLLDWRERTAGCGGGTTNDSGSFWAFYAPIVAHLFAKRAH